MFEESSLENIAIAVAIVIVLDRFDDGFEETDDGGSVAIVVGVSGGDDSVDSEEERVGVRNE
ncbi:hypothetical protein HanRHA438_Chr05g0246171 [Helianthus annuus]|nr:hypothetical protein HanRHA438_Chr05g0246171 [Helianthus annuus]